MNSLLEAAQADAAEWAMKFAEMAKRQAKTEQRLAGLIQESKALSNIVEELLDCIANPDEKALKLIKTIKDMNLWVGDLDIQIWLNMVDPPWEIPEDLREKLPTITDPEDIPEDYKKRITEWFLESAKATAETWDDLATEKDWPTWKQLRHSRNIMLRDAIGKTLEKMAEKHGIPEELRKLIKARIAETG